MYNVTKTKAHSLPVIACTFFLYIHCIYLNAKIARDLSKSKYKKPRIAHIIPNHDQKHRQAKLLKTSVCV
jgi:hypothetical protein